MNSSAELFYLLSPLEEMCYFLEGGSFLKQRQKEMKWSDFLPNINPIMEHNMSSLLPPVGN